MMNMNKILLLLIFSVLFTVPSLASEALNEANAHFTYQGEPIHPFLIEKFSNWISDNRSPIVVTVDISASFNTNQYSQSDIQKNDNWWRAERHYTDGDIPLYESFSYQWLGRLNNGTHVLKTGSSGGGSGFFMDLMFIRFSTGEIMWEGKEHKQLLMSIVGTHSLGDRYMGDIQVFPDRVIIPASMRFGYPDGDDVELNFSID
jgi:hypothetical protein